MGAANQDRGIVMREREQMLRPAGRASAPLPYRLSRGCSSRLPLPSTRSLQLRSAALRKSADMALHTAFGELELRPAIRARAHEALIPLRDVEQHLLLGLQ